MMIEPFNCLGTLDSESGPRFDSDGKLEVRRHRVLYSCKYPPEHQADTAVTELDETCKDVTVFATKHEL